MKPAVPQHVDHEDSGVIEDPDARANWRDENRTMRERIKVVEGKFDAVLPIIYGLQGGMAILVEGQKASNEEREARRAREQRDAEQALERERIRTATLEAVRERRAKLYGAFFKVIAPILLAAAGVITAWKATR